MVSDCLRDLHAELAGVKFLGSYPAAGPAGPAIRREVDSSQRQAEEWIERLRAEIEMTEYGGRPSLIDRSPDNSSAGLPWQALGGMAERTNARLLKSREGKASVGSNPTPSAGCPHHNIWAAHRHEHSTTR